MALSFAKVLGRRKDGYTDLRPLLRQEMFPQVSDDGTPVVVHGWDFREKDQLKLVSVPDAAHVENSDCMCCGSAMTKITQVENTAGATSVESSWCPNCEFIQHTQGYAREWLHDHFRDRWLEQRPVKRVKPSDNILKRVEDVLPESSVILDVGCGNGDKLIPFSQRGHECYGVEPCSREVDLARQWFPAEQIIHASAEEFLTNPDGPEANLAFISGVLAFIENPFVVMRQVLEKVKPGGYLFVIEPNYTSTRWNVFYNSHMVICPSYFSAKCFAEFARQHGLAMQIRSNAPLGVLFRRDGDIPGPRSLVEDTPVNPETLYEAIDGQLHFNRLQQRRLLKLHYRRFGMTACIGAAKELPEENRPIQERFPIRFIHHTPAPPVLLK